MFRCGTDVRAITPVGPAYLMGYAARRGKATDGAVHDALYAKALYLEKDGTRALLISCDLCELRLSDAVRIREDIARETGVDAVLVSVTHTHSGPGTFYDEIEMPHFDAAWFAFARAQMVEAARGAMRQPFEAGLCVCVTDAPEVGKNRRPDSDVTDPALTVLAFADADKTIRAVLLNYACHCTILDGNSYTVSADYPGYLYAQIAARYPGAVVLFTNGAAGDINIGYSSDASALGEPMPFRSFETAERMARILSDKACAAIDGMRFDENPALGFQTVPVRYPLRRDAPSDEALAQTIALLEGVLASQAPDEVRREAEIKRIYAQILRANMRALGRGADIAADSYLLRIGKALLASFPVELFCEVGLAWKARLPQGVVGVPVGYAGGYLGYLPTERAMRAGGYESETSPFAPEAASVLVDTLAEAAIETWTEV